MIPKEVKSRHGYIYHKKNQSPLLVEMWQHDIEDLMLGLSEASALLKDTGHLGTANKLDRHRQLLQGKVECHRARGEWK